MIETPALMPPDAPPDWDMPFLNLVVVGRTTLSPKTLLDRVKGIEAHFGRKAAARWAPRPLDIDILIHGSTRSDDPTLTLPHPGMTEREFVLRPLAQLWPDWRHPLTGLTVAQHLTRLTEAPR